MDFEHASVDLPGVPVESALAAFTDPSLLARWWGGELTIEPRRGGAYTVRFASLDRTLTGRVLAYQPPERLVFRWQWDGVDPSYQVEVLAVPAGDGSRLELTHGPYTDSATDREERTSHRDGWSYFLPRLAALFTA